MNEQKIMNKLKMYQDGTVDYDKLEALFNLQDTFDEYIKEKRGLDYSDKDYWIQQMCRCIITEACELNDATNWKHWKNPKELDWKNIHEEIIDLWHFLISVSIKADLNPKDIINKYIEKNIENYNRQTGDSKRDGYEHNKSQL